MAKKWGQNELPGIRRTGRSVKKIFDVVRLVDVDKTEVVMPEQSHACYAVWNRQERCENCISARVVAQRCQLTKIEFVDSKIYLVISHYVEIDGKGYALEMVTEIRDELLLELMDGVS